MPSDNPEIYEELKQIAARLLELAGGSSEEEPEMEDSAEEEAAEMPTSGGNKMNTALSFFKKE